METQRQPVAPMVVLAGPTGSGKSDLAVRIAEEFEGEVVNCDSVQVYRGFDIGTAKLPETARRGIPHHLIDVCEAAELFTAGDYARLARAAIAEISRRRRLPVVAGGTGFYLRALLDGLFEGPGRDEALRERLFRREGRRPGSLHRLLRRLDPAAARRIHAADVNKTVRALEVILTARERLSSLYAQGRRRLEGYRTLKIALDPPRTGLYLRIENRARAMFALGLVDEVRRHLERGVPRSARPFTSLGYVQALGVLDGRLTLEQAVAETALRTRRYAKRQWTWFRRQDRFEWFAGFGDDTAVADAVCARVARFLAGE